MTSGNRLTSILVIILGIVLLGVVLLAVRAAIGPGCSGAVCDAIPTGNARLLAGMAVVLGLLVVLLLSRSKEGIAGVGIAALAFVGAVAFLPSGWSGNILPLEPETTEPEQDETPSFQSRMDQARAERTEIDLSPLSTQPHDAIELEVDSRNGGLAVVEFRLEEATQLSIYIGGGSETDPAVELYEYIGDSDPAEDVYSLVFVESDDDSGNNLDSELNVNLEPGLYILEIRDLAVASLRENRPFFLSFSAIIQPTLALTGVPGEGDCKTTPSDPAVASCVQFRGQARYTSNPRDDVFILDFDRSQPVCLVARMQSDDGNSSVLALFYDESGDIIADSIAPGGSGGAQLSIAVGGPSASFRGASGSGDAEKIGILLTSREIETEYDAFIAVEPIPESGSCEDAGLSRMQ